MCYASCLQMSSGRSSRRRTTRGGGRSKTQRIDDPPIVVPSPHTVAPSPPTVAPSPPTIAPSPPTIVPSPTAPSPPTVVPSPPIAPSPHSSVHSNPQHDNEEAQIDNEQLPHHSGKPWGKDPIDHKTWIYPDKKTFVLYFFSVVLGS
ncbi:Helicase conserved C-terminal domain-containing protein [Senna tora]|uniref:Helicase conserved C-terminal domain-containing protein n=1 Tax=Senna tora TaxID=362788 RepID=A0A834T8Y8_9FABA|nr:Helicase conserved C-terminal domain-containing protein [Senna tora]